MESTLDRIVCRCQKLSDEYDWLESIDRLCTSETASSHKSIGSNRSTYPEDTKDELLELTEISVTVLPQNGGGSNFEVLSLSISWEGTLALLRIWAGISDPMYEPYWAYSYSSTPSNSEPTLFGKEIGKVSPKDAWKNYLANKTPAKNMEFMSSTLEYVEETVMYAEIIRLTPKAFAS